jgi:dienelactone hydrolase
LSGSVLFYPSQPVFESLGPLRPAHPRDLVWNHRAPLLLLYGDEDKSVPLEMQDDLRDELTRWNVNATTREYEGAGHVFAGTHFGDSYRPEADQDSWQLAVEFARRCGQR